MKIRSEKRTSFAPVAVKTVDLLDYTGRTVNFFKTGGAFVPAVCQQDQTIFKLVSSTARMLYYAPFSRTLYAITPRGGACLEYGMDIWRTVLIMSPSSPFFVDMYIDGLMKTVLFNGASRAVNYGGESEVVSGGVDFCTGVVHCGRFFGVESANRFKVCWSASSPLDWPGGIEGSGYVCLPAEGGEVRRLLSYKDRLIAMRERGITVIHAYGEPQNFKVDATAHYATAPGIIEGTCAFCDGVILFCTRDGLCSFDGSTVSDEASFAELGISSPGRAASCGSMYVLKCTCEGVGENCIYCYDRAIGSGCACAISVTMVFDGPDGIYVSKGSAAKRLTRGGTGTWTSRAVRFGGGSDALLKSVDIDCDGAATLTVTSRGISRTFSGGGRHAVDMRGEEFYFTVTADGELRGLTARAEV